MSELRQLGDVLPELTAEICRLLRDEDEGGLAGGFPGLPFVEWCDCGDDFCQGFCTAARPDGAYGPGHRNVMLSPDTGMIVLDVVNGAVMFAEVLYRPESKASFRHL